MTFNLSLRCYFFPHHLCGIEFRASTIRVQNVTDLIPGGVSYKMFTLILVTCLTLGIMGTEQVALEGELYTEAVEH